MDVFILTFYPARIPSKLMHSFDELFEQAVKRAREINDITLKPIEGIETIITHGGHDPLALPDMGHPVVPPITLSTTFQQLAPATGKVASIIFVT